MSSTRALGVSAELVQPVGSGAQPAAGIKASAAQAERAKEEAARVTSLKLEELKALHGEERDRLTARIGQAFDAGYGFARYCHTAPGWKANADHDALPANAVIPTLAMNGSVDFNQRFPGNNYLRFENWRRITSRAELEDLLDTILGRDPTRSRE